MRRLAFWCVVLSVCAATVFAGRRLTTEAEPITRTAQQHSNGLAPTPAPPPQSPLLGPGPALGGTPVVKHHAQTSSFVLRDSSTDVAAEFARSLLLARRAPAVLSVPLRI